MMEAVATTITEGKNMPALRFPEFEGEWSKRKIGEISKIKHGFAFKGEYFNSEGPYIILTPGNFDTDGGFRYQGRKEKYYTDDSFPKEYLLKEGELLTVMTEQAVGLIGSAIITPKSDLFLHNQRLGLFQITSDIRREFLFHLMKTESLRAKFSKSAAGTKVRHTSPQRIEAISITIPTVLEQQKIADFLSAIDAKIQQLVKKKLCLDKYKKGALQQLLSQQLRFKDDAGQDFPVWKVKKAKDIFKNHSNKKHKGDLPILAITQGMGTVLRDSIGIDIKSSEASINSYKIIEKGDFIISLRSFQGGIEYSDITGICSPAYTVLKTTIEIDNTFFKYYFKNESFIQQLSATVVGIRDGKQISYDAFSGMKLLFPSVPEQAKIASFLAAIDDKIALVAKQLHQAQQLKKGLLQQMFV